MKNKKGLTLVELIAAIAVLAIVLGIVVVNVARIKKSVDKKNKENAIRAVLEAARSYCDETHECNMGDSTHIQLWIGTDPIDAKKLKKIGKVKFDNKYDSDIFFTTQIYRRKCVDSSRTFYIIQVGADQYNDCGCEEQGGDPNAKEICNTSTGKY